MKVPKAVPVTRHETPPDYERFFDNYYNLGPPACVFERERAPGGNRDGKKLPALRRLRRRGRGQATS
jgi:hypothetical protein